MTAILGISAFYHDSAAALVIDGEIVAAAQEERFTRKKHDADFPTPADRLLPAKKRGMTPPSSTTWPSTTSRCTKFERLLETYLAFAPAGLRSFAMAMPVWLKEKLFMRRDDPQRPRRRRRARRCVFTDHHESHAASAFFPSPFDEAAILTLDGVASGARRHAASARATGSS